MKHLIETAQALLDNGIYTVPTKKKIPIGKDWPKMRGGWLSSPPRGIDGIGVITGSASGVICLDIDIEDNASPELLKFRDELCQKLPAHIYSGRRGSRTRPPSPFFAYNGERKRNFMNAKIDLLGDGAQVVVAPSMHQNGYKYEVVGVPLEKVDLGMLPVLDPEIIKFIEDSDKVMGRSLKDQEVKTTQGRCNNGSHNKMSKIGLAMFYQFDSDEKIINELLKKDRDYNSGADFLYFNCPSRSWKTTDVHANARAFVEDLQERNSSNREQQAKLSRVKIRSAESIESKKVEHYDGEDKILAKGMIIGISGDPGAGKSRMVRKLISEISNGKTLSGKNIKPVNSLLFSAEDHAESVVKQDLTNYGADQKRIFIIDEPCAVDQQFVATHEAFIKDNNIKVLVFDTITSYMREGDDINALNKVNEFFGPLIKLAKNLNLCIIFIRHLTKQTSQGASIYRGMGSIGITGSFRSEFHVVKDSRDSLIRHMVHIKCNFAKNTLDCAYTFNGDGSVNIESFTHVDDIDKAYLEITSTELGLEARGQGGKLELATVAAYNFLKSGESMSSKEFSGSMKELGFTEATIRRSREAVGQSIKVKDSKGVFKNWKIKLKEGYEPDFDQDDFIDSCIQEEVLNDGVLCKEEEVLIHEIFSKSDRLKRKHLKVLLVDNRIDPSRAEKVIEISCATKLELDEKDSLQSFVIKKCSTPDVHFPVGMVEHLEKDYKSAEFGGDNAL